MTATQVLPAPTHGPGAMLCSVRNDEAEYTELVHRIWPRLSRTARVLARSQADADEALSLALERIYAKWRLVRRADNPEAYALGILARAVADTHRRGWLTRTRLTGDPTELDRWAAEADPASGTVEHLALLTAMRRLPERQRAVVALRYLDDLSVADTADALGVTEGTVKRACSDGLANLRRFMEVES